MSGLQASESVAMKVAVTSSTGESLANIALSAKANASGSVRQTVSVSDLKAKYGVSLRGGERMALKATAVSTGKTGEATAIVSGSAPLGVAANASVEAGVSATVRNLRAGEAFTGTFDILSKTGASLGLSLIHI